MKRRFALPLCLLMLGAAPAAGCGGDELSEEDYTNQVQEAIAPVVETSQTLVTEATQAKSVEELGAPLGEAASTYGETASTLEDIEPPEDVTDLHERLVTAHEQIADSASAAANAAEDGDQAGVEPFREAGDAYRTELESLVGEYQDKGYEFGGASSP